MNRPTLGAHRHYGNYVGAFFTISGQVGEFLVMILTEGLQSVAKIILGPKKTCTVKGRTVQSKPALDPHHPKGKE